jgi:polyhydroxyalkanoate synthesis regulator phasin
MAKQDQEARAFLHSSGLHVDSSREEVVRMREVDAANVKRLKHIVNQEGFPTAEMVGIEGVSAAWLLTIHAGSDPDFQETVLKLTTEHVRRGEIRRDQVAMLTDDLLAGRGKPQRYGTNFELRDGELRPAPMEDEANVEKLRRAVGLGSLANYACVLRAMYGSPKP